MICVVREDSEDDLCKEENNLSHQGRWICVSIRTMIYVRREYYYLHKQER